MKTHKVLVTGVGICGKTTLANKLEADLKERGIIVQNSDIDYDENWREIVEGTDVYLLQTPHGSQSEETDGIEFGDFDEILYIEADEETYKRLLSVRGCAWFRKGVVEATEDFDPKPQSLEKLPGIMEKIAGYAMVMPKLTREDKKFFSKNPKTRFLRTRIEGETLGYQGYQKALDEILSEVNK